MLLKSISNKMNNLRDFSFKNKTLMEWVFISLYAFEQIFLIFLINLYPKYINMIVSLFSIIVLSTFSMHKLVMESRTKIFEEKAKYVQSQFATLRHEINEYKEQAKLPLRALKKGYGKIYK